MTMTHFAPVLVVEDSDEDWDTVCEAARRGGHEDRLYRVVDGESCLSLIHSRADYPGTSAVVPALVLLDLNLPGIDGREVLATIKADERWKTLPVVVCSTSSDPRDIATCYAAGVNAFHVKPMRYDEHLSSVRSLLDYWLWEVKLPGALIAS